MAETNRPGMTHRKLLLFKWLMVLIPPITVAAGHTLLLGHTVDGLEVGGSLTPEETLLVTALVTFLAVVLACAFDAQDTLQACRDLRVTTMSLAPTMIALLLDQIMGIMAIVGGVFVASMTHLVCRKLGPNNSFKPRPLRGLARDSLAGCGPA